GYGWTDSDQPDGPVFEWMDVAGVGTELVLGDDDYEIVALPFAFPFYGNAHNSVRIDSNGYLSFDGNAFSEYNNAPIPSTFLPNDLVAAFWEDLNPSAGGTIHYHHDPQTGRFLVQYTDVVPYAADGVYTFQVILEPGGTIRFQYLSMQGEIGSATIGIEDPAGVSGLPIEYNGNYVHDNLAIEIIAGCEWLSVTPQAGSTYGGASTAVTVTADATDLPYGEYTCELVVMSNDADEPEIVVPVVVNVHRGLDAPIVAGAPTSFALHASFPNPFRDATTIGFDLPVASDVSLRVFDVTGRLVTEVERGRFAAGRHRVRWSGLDSARRPVSSGVYFYRLDTGSFSETHRVVVMK
ncbi:MAG: T9SS type A sorting domain-containing protein, partial [Phycisphaerales bacterium]|nr:T9SS type A sorting domain-containing protein [Phycisphaerales bacterium]